MRLIIEFDVDADVIDVPQHVLDNRELLRNQFLKWLYSPNSKHKYRKKLTDGSGKKIYCMQYRSDAFVEWLNRKILADCGEKAVVIQQYISRDQFSCDLPVIFF